jgi:hypothetical protein
MFEQLAVMLRYVGTEERCVGEEFVKFVAGKKQLAPLLTDAIFSEIQLVGLSINDCRGQGYYSGTNTVGVNQHVRTCISAISARDFINTLWMSQLPGDAAKSSTLAISFPLFSFWLIAKTIRSSPGLPRIGRY